MGKNKIVVRPARKRDRPAILELMNQYPDKLELRPEFLPKLDEYFVVTVNREVVACGALSTQVEIRGLAVKKGHERNGYGSKLVDACEQRAQRRRYRQVVLMTDQGTVGFFEGLGYRFCKGSRVAMVKDKSQRIL